MTGKVVPIKGGSVGSGYRSADRPDHRGVDFPASFGTPIYAAADGFVVRSGPATGFGNWIVLDHQRELGVDTVYGHMAARDLLVRAGDTVTAGQVIARVGSEGQSSGPHLHFEVWGPPGRFGGADQNPSTWLRDARQPGTSAPAPLPQTKGDKQLIADVTVLTRNDSGWRDPNTCTHICQHTNEGPAFGSLEGLLDWCANPISEASYNLIVHGDGRIGRSNDDDYIPWAAGPISNRKGLHVCAMGYAEETREQWLSRPAQLDSLGEIWADWAVRHYIGLQKVDGNQLRAGAEGVCGHGDTARAWGETSHTDPGVGFPYDVVLQIARDKINQEDGLSAADADRVVANLTEFIKGYLAPVISDVKDLREQVTGSRDLHYKDPERKVVDLQKSYPGLKILGNRTLPDTVAALAQAAGIKGAIDPKPGA